MTFTDPHDGPPVITEAGDDQRYPAERLRDVERLVLLQAERLAEISVKLDALAAFNDELRPVLAQASAMADSFAGQSPMQLLGSLFGR